jgi:hypothetical protein
VTNNFRAAQRTAQELEAEVHAVPVKKQDPEIRQILYMIDKKLASLFFWLERAEQHELAQT